MGTKTRISRLSIWTNRLWIAAGSCLFLVTRPACAESANEATASPSWLTPTLSYDADVAGNLSGGLRRGPAYVGNVHLKLNANGTAMEWPGTSAFVDLLQIHGGQPSRLVGDAMGVSNIAGPAGAQVEELWLQHNSHGGITSVLAGIYDLNSEFYRLRSAGLFVNSAFGVGPEFAQSGVEGPSIFPRTAAGVRVSLKPVAGTVIRAAMLDGVPVARPDGSHSLFKRGDGVLAVGEVAFLAREEDPGAKHDSPRELIGRFSSLSPYDDKLALGAWRYSGRYPDLSDQGSDGSLVLRRGMSGAYVVGETILAGRMATSERHLAAFAQVGIADPRTNRFASYLGGGLVGSGWEISKASDQIGLSIAHGRNGSHYLSSSPAFTTTRSETAFELTYLTQVSNHVAIQPDVQYVIHPNTDRSVRNATVLQLRLECSY